MKRGVEHDSEGGGGEDERKPEAEEAKKIKRTVEEARCVRATVGQLEEALDAKVATTAAAHEEEGAACGREQTEQTEQ